MAEINLVAEVGRRTGSSVSRRLRHTGRVPAVVYGHGMEPLAVSVDARDLRHALTGHGLNQVLTLQVGKDTHMVLARQLQRHPVRRTVAHVDFQVVRGDEIVSAEVPVVLAGTAAQVQREGGMLEHTLTTLTVRSTPANIPEQIPVDVSELTVGDVLRVRDLRLPPGVTTDADPEEAVVIAATPSVAAEVPEGAGEEAAAEGEGTAAGPSGAGASADDET